MAMPAYVGGSIAMAGMKWIPSVPGIRRAACRAASA